MLRGVYAVLLYVAVRHAVYVPEPPRPGRRARRPLSISHNLSAVSSTELLNKGRCRDIYLIWDENDGVRDYIYCRIIKKNEIEGQSQKAVWAFPVAVMVVLPLVCSE